MTDSLISGLVFSKTTWRARRTGSCARPSMECPLSLLPRPPMLTCLRIRDLAIIEQLELCFGPGLNVVTGETGAGKSIVVDALELLLGGRGKPELVRTGAPQAEVEALFEVGDDPELRATLTALVLEP